MHKRMAVLALAALAALAPACDDRNADARSRPPTGGDDPRETAERLVATLDYVASDYRAAVPDSGPPNEAEYEEQIRMVEAARRLAGELPALPKGELDALDRAVRARTRADEVARACARTRGHVVDLYAVAAAPALPPSRARGESLFTESCSACHGATGHGDGPRAATLTPRPANLCDPARMAAMTPYRAYCAVTYGVEGTSMPAQSMPASDRWSVAFYACALRHLESPPPARRPASEPRVGLATLANSTDQDLARLLDRTVPEDRDAALARLRTVAPFETSAGSSPVALARASIARARDAASTGRRAEADALVLDAYLKGIEEIEAPIRARDAALVPELEDAVAALRAAINGGEDPARIRDRAGQVLVLLDRAELLIDVSLPSRFGSGAAALIAGLMAALIVLREGLEAALIIAAILAILRRMGLKPQARRAVHLGWTSALAAGALTFLGARTVLMSFPVGHEALEGAVGVVSAGVLFATSFWLISKADAKRWLAYVKERAGGSAAGGGLGGLFALSFLVTYREAFETILFFEALVGGRLRDAAPVALGAILGAAALAAAVYALLRLERRLPLGPFFATSGALLVALAVILLGHGIHAIETTSALVPRPITFPRVDWLGIYPDALSLGAQAVMIGIVAVAAITLRRSTATPRAA